MKPNAIPMSKSSFFISCLQMWIEVVWLTYPLQQAETGLWVENTATGGLSFVVQASRYRLPDIARLFEWLNRQDLNQSGYLE